MRIKYHCDFCESEFNTEEECKKHESEECEDNPKTKSCTTCKFQTYFVSGTNRVCYKCKKNLLTAIVDFAQHCPEWEFDEGYAH